MPGLKQIELCHHILRKVEHPMISCLTINQQMSWITIVNDAVPWAWTQCDSVTIFENVDIYQCMKGDD